MLKLYSILFVGMCIIYCIFSILVKYIKLHVFDLYYFTIFVKADNYIIVGACVYWTI